MTENNNQKKTRLTVTSDGNNVCARLLLTDKPQSGGEEIAPGVILHYDEDNNLAEIEMLNIDQFYMKKVMPSIAEDE